MITSQNIGATIEASEAGAVHALCAARFAVEKQMGSGYGEQHPELLAAFMNVYAQEMSNHRLVDAIQDFTAALNKLTATIERTSSKGSER